ncbi:MAG TPA: hypothetical protein VLL48_08700, partial [Longimicrobiales bacterium]|nr:hypothetical protein [Longimicrobiales bacterium]
MPVRIRRAEARRVTLRGPEGDTTAALERAVLTGSAGPDGIRVDSLGLHGLAGRGARFSAGLRGGVGGAQPHPLRASLRWSGRLPGGHASSGRGSLSGDLDEARAELALRAPLVAEASVTVQRPFEEPRWTAALRIPGTDLRSLSPSLPDLRAEATVEGAGTADSVGALASFSATPPGGEPLPGRVAVTWRRGRLTVDTLSLRLPARDGRLAARGWLETGGESPRGALWTEWSELAWPLAGEAAVVSPGGRLSAEGEARSFAYEGDLSLRGPNLPATGWRIEGRGSRTGDTLGIRAEARTLVEGIPAVRTTLRATRVPGRVTLEEVVARIEGTPTTLRGAGALLFGEGGPAADLRVDWRDLGWPLTGAARYASREGTLRIDGTRERFRVSLDAAAAGGALPDGRWRGTVTGTGSGDTLRARADLRAELAGIGEVRLFGRTTRTPERLRVHELTARTPASGAEIRLEGELRPGAELPVVAARGRWTDVSWPRVGTPTVTSARGRVEAESRAGGLAVRSELALAGPSVPEGEWHLNGRVTPDSVVVDSMRAEILGGRL